MFTGRMPIGVQPWPTTDTEATERLGLIVDFYDWLLGIKGIELAHTDVVRETAPDVHVMLINNAVHAATAVIPGGQFNTTAIQDALASLAGKIEYRVAPDTNITEAGIPELIISTSLYKPVSDPNSFSKVYELPFYPGAEGKRYTIVTCMDGTAIPEELPKILQDKLDAYWDRFMIPLLSVG
jgi:hypothetical protein